MNVISFADAALSAAEIEEVIANGHVKLDRLMIAETP